MSKNYAAGIPMGNNSMPASYNAPPAFKAIARYTDEDNSASSVLTLTENTTAIEIAAQGASVIMRWIPVAETAAVSPFASVIGIAGATANYDHVIPANTYRRFVVPIESFVGDTASSVQGANRENGLYRRVAIKGAVLLVSGSVLTTEYGSSNTY